MPRIVGLLNSDNQTVELELDPETIPREGEYITVGSDVHEVRALWRDGSRIVLALRHLGSRDAVLSRMRSEAQSVPLAGGA